MRSRLILFPVLAWTACALTAAAAGVSGDQPRVELRDLTWLAGYWSSEPSGVVKEECWLPPSGGVMLGLHRDTFGDGRMSFEYLRIMETPDGLAYYASPRGYETTKFMLTALTDDAGVKRAVFENPTNDYPRVIRYTLSAEVLMAEVEGLDDDQNVMEVWTWRRADFPVTP